MAINFAYFWDSKTFNKAADIGIASFCGLKTLTKHQPDAIVSEPLAYLSASVCYYSLSFVQQNGVDMLLYSSHFIKENYNHKVAFSLLIGTLSVSACIVPLLLLVYDDDSIDNTYNQVVVKSSLLNFSAIVCTQTQCYKLNSLTTEGLAPPAETNWHYF